ncbi:MAG: hypothetical protein C0506_07480 [Anaerolinea sp.]|nr:hypothetical protein [Anaerolinea sp.]
MAEERDLGPLVHISAEALGQPGQRRFRLRAMNDRSESAVLWLEKEQLIALGEAIETVLKGEGYNYQRLPLDDREPEAVLPLDAFVEMRLAQLSMGLNREKRCIVLIAGDSQDPDAHDAATVMMEFDYRRGYELRGQISAVVAAGRPPCPLCTGPMDPEGHVCVKTNGHHPH